MARMTRFSIFIKDIIIRYLGIINFGGKEVSLGEGEELKSREESRL